MSTTEEMQIQIPADIEAITARRDEFSGRIMHSLAGAFDVFALYIGHKLGYYKALSRWGAMTSTRLAQRTGTQERYAREWLEQQTVTGVLEVINPQAGPLERRYLLPGEYEEVLTDEDSPNYMTPLIQSLVGVTRPMTSLLEAYRRGGGVPLSEYGEDFRLGQEGTNRVTFLKELGQVWIPAMPDVHARLQAGPPARVADIGVGAGWSSIGLALQYPNITIDGFDLDEPSIEKARENARRYQVDDRVHFSVRDAADPELEGQYDLVTAFETVHDMSNPTGALRTMRRMANGSGAVLVVDERVGEQFTPTGNDIEWMMYGWSFLHCLAVGLADVPSAGTGTVMRPDTLRAYAREAGFRDIEILPVENDFFRLYRMLS